LGAIGRVIGARGGELILPKLEKGDIGRLQIERERLELERSRNKQDATSNPSARKRGGLSAEALSEIEKAAKLLG
jgi:hypothetical protein